MVAVNLLDCLGNFLYFWSIGDISKNGSYGEFSSVAQSCPTLFNPMDCSMPDFPVHHQLLELTQIHVHRVADDIQPSHSLSTLLLPVSVSFPMSQFFTSGDQVLELKL